MADKIKNTKAEQEYVDVYIPPKGKEDQIFIALNFKTYMVKRGEYVRLPKAVYDVYLESLNAEERAERYVLAKEAAYLEKASKH